MGVPVNRLMRVALALVLLVASSSAAALGLGQIHLKSKLGEPLLAEIPIVSSDPTELENLRAGLASPETFARIGLDLPQGVVANLQFVPALDDAGRPVIRVTSVVPIEEPLLTFLVEVDWGQGRLVREYSTLMDAPRTLAAAAQPSIQAATQAPGNTIVRDAVAQPADPADAGGIVAGDDTPSGMDADAISVDAPPAHPASPPTRYGAVRSGEYLSIIADGLDMGGNLQQKMIALLQANPQAFIDGNIHRLKQGTVLRIPDAQEVAAISVAQAAAQVREQTSAWRAATQPVPQPQIAGTGGDIGDASEPAASEAPAVAATDGARLEIVPPGASDASRAGTQSGISAGGEGDMVRQQLQATTETLAARDAELGELKSRIETLEQLQADQQRLLEMKDSELASAQQQLAESQSVDSGSEAAAASSVMPWLLGGSGLVLVLVGAWWLRRRADATPRFRAPTAPARKPSGLAAGFPAAAVERAGHTGPDVLNPQPQAQAPQAVQPATPAPTGDPAVATPAPVVVPAPEPQSANPAVPAWHSAAGNNRLNKASSAAQAGTSRATTPPAAVADTSAGAEDSEAPGMDRLELARAYLDLGDQDSARQLLGELVVSGNLEARQHATRLLRELG